MLFFRVNSEYYWSLYEDNSRNILPEPSFHLFITIELFNNLKEVLKGKFSAGSNITYYPAEHRVKLNLSIFEALLFVSECIVKPTFGKEYFAQIESAVNSFIGK